MISRQQFLAKWDRKIPTDVLQIDDGWLGMIDNFLSSIAGWDIDGQHTPGAIEYLNVLQIKEKFGVLRFYTSFRGIEDDYERGVLAGKIALLESLSSMVCEVCGNPGILRHGGYLQTVCDEHYTPHSPDVHPPV